MRNDLQYSIEQLPEIAGGYFFYGDQERLLYIGKSINIKKRVLQHFSGKDRKSLKIQMFTQKITFEPMGSELIALLHESDLIKKHQPIYNRAQRRTLYPYGLYLGETNDYKSLVVQKIIPGKDELMAFSSMKEAKNALFKITENHHLCQKINELYKTKDACFQYQIKECDGACIGLESTDSYNQRVVTFIEQLHIKKFTRILEMVGRHENEKGLVYIENDVYKDFGFCPSTTNKNTFLDFIEYKQDNKDIRRILIRYLLKYSG